MTRSQLVFGLLFVVLGVLLLADQAGLLSTWQIAADWWPTVIVVAGLAQLVTWPRNVVGAVLLFLVGGMLLLWTLDVVETVALVWPVLLIGLGLWLLAGRTGRRPDRLAGSFDLSAVFDDRSARVEAGPFEGGSVTAVFGDARLDLTSTHLEDEGATLHATTIFGDITLDVPEGWQVRASGPELLGDVKLDGLAEPPADAPVLQLRVLTVFGDITVRGGRPVEGQGSAVWERVPGG
jgi:hypothetical protein